MTDEGKYTDKSSPEGENCGNCRFWVKGKRYEGVTPSKPDVDPGWCHRNQPICVHIPPGHPLFKGARVFTNSFPRVDGDQWCGQWEPVPDRIEGKIRKIR